MLHSETVAQVIHQSFFFKSKHFLVKIDLKNCESYRKNNANVLESRLQLNAEFTAKFAADLSSFGKKNRQKL